MSRQALPQFLDLCLRLGLTPIPLKPRSKEPLVRWGNGWAPTLSELNRWATKPGTNWGVRCGENLAVLDFDSDDSFHSFLEAHLDANSWPRVKTGRGFHLWVRPKKPIRSQRLNAIEIKGIGSYVVAPPSIHPSGVPYIFDIAPDGALPEVDLEGLLGLSAAEASSQAGVSIHSSGPSEFALRYGKSDWPQSMCGKATKVFTRSDGKMKKLLSLRCWKWDCPKCAPLLERHWLEKLKGLPCRFILRLPTWDKPTKFLRRLGKPRYVHIAANGKGWLFLMDGEAEPVWAEARRVGYALVAGDIAGDPTPEEIADCLAEALCREEEPLNTRRKITHSRALFRKAAQASETYESNQKTDCSEGESDMKAALGSEALNWSSEVVMKPIEQVATELKSQGWGILWQSEVEALAIRGEATEDLDGGIVELLDMLGVRLKQVGKEYVGLCPFHDDHKPSLSVNKGKGLWHCFGCGRGGDAHKFVEQWQALRY